MIKKVLANVRRGLTEGNVEIGGGTPEKGHRFHGYASIPQQGRLGGLATLKGEHVIGEIVQFLVG
jgi:hypothetical protein